ncbi:SH3 beta-barrel fold-containing protein [Cytophagaceae bacterium DM2B3-1]|uniref:SH3 beta-barrel fold-containing protein n=1 Tax=Xanthocytophaga flava TaxID=3048013 RepID=A0ABT7CS59_9BACT|nr:SH3 beta-barrel fold-containing protein [Xanthocytophaga flavus]MDJ1496568.1 SH3 beta-barrel fold-containing protein [Xanthocytophaga flavus]
MKALAHFRVLVMQKAWNLVKEEGISLSQALKDAWALVRLQALKALMKLGAVLVTFRKVNGEVTTRKATRNMDLVPTEKHPKYGSRESEYIWTLPFFSLTDNAWRSLKAENLISFSIL